MNDVKQIIKEQLDIFLPTFIEDENLRKDIFSDEDFDQILQNDDVKNLFDDNEYSFTDGITLGLNFGVRIGTVFTVSQLKDLANLVGDNHTPDKGVSEESDVVEVDSSEITYS